MMCYFSTRFNMRSVHGGSVKFGMAKAASRKPISVTSDQRIEQLKKVNLKKRTEAKINWAVTAFNEWHEERLTNFNYNVAIYECNLNELETLTKENLNHAMCRFIPEVNRKKGDGLHPGRTLYQLVTSIQKYLHVNKLFWKILDGKEFEDMHNVLDNVMKERTQAQIGTVKHQANVISYDFEKDLWEKGVLGDQSPDQLRHTVLFLLGINCTLRAGDEHYQLRRETPLKKSQIQFEVSELGERCFIYYEDTGTKSNDGGLKHMRYDRKIVWVHPNNVNRERCPVRLVEKYLSLCPPVKKKDNFYL